MPKSIDIIAREIERLENARQDAAMRYERGRNPAMLRRMRRLSVLLQDLRQRYALVETDSYIAQRSRL